LLLTLEAQARSAVFFLGEMAETNGTWMKLGFNQQKYRKIGI
jgi:hypothetical protein